ncbi:MAG: hypothetical protein ABIB04_03405 [Patescibacteria group bacterium]
MQKLFLNLKNKSMKGSVFIFLMVLTSFCQVLFAHEVRAESLTDCSHLDDVKGDVSINTTTSTVKTVSPGRADMVSADLKLTDGLWQFSLTNAEPITAEMGENFSILLLLDTNNSSEDNYWDDNDRRAGGDTYYLMYFTNTTTRLWNIHKYRFNVADDKWHQYLTSSTMDIADRTLTVKIPVAELPATAGKTWRVLTAVGKQNWVSRDDLPDKRDDANSCGFMSIPPKPGDSSVPMTKAPTSTAHGFWNSSWGDALTVAITIALLISVFGMSVWNSRLESEE